MILLDLQFKKKSNMFCLYSYIVFNSTDVPCYDEKNEVAYACKLALNELSARRVIGQAETHHSCLQLPLTLCSDHMFEIILSGWYKLRFNKQLQTY